MNRLAAALLALGLALVAAQSVRFPRTNPPIKSAMPAPARVEALLRRGCYDCHSNETRWPWYTAVAPPSWLAHHDVVEGRKRLNFSAWDAYISDPGTAIHKLEKVRRLADLDEMPPWHYRLFHREARLSPSDRQLLSDWTSREIDKLASHAGDLYDERRQAP